jgi:hypothetical protein
MMTERLTPFDLVFGDGPLDATRFERVREQDRAGAATIPELLMLPSAGELLHELMPADTTAEPGSSVPQPPHREIIAQVGALLFQAYRFWREGRQVFRFGRASLERVIAPADEPAAAAWAVRAPAAAGYVQFPRNLLWARVSADAAAEPVDGFFWSVPDASAPARLDLLFALGVRPGRPGLSLVEVAVENGAALHEWLHTQVRADGVDFDNILPGGELQGYAGLTTHAEALKLAVLCFRAIDAAGAREAVAENGSSVVLLDDG